MRGEFATYRIGTSGYQYRHWRGVFYPPKLPPTQWFQYYAQHFEMVEINNTFYRLPAAEVFSRWRKDTPSNFCFALKLSRYATHLKKLKDADQTIPRFLERAQRLEATLGPLLLQLPPNWKVDAERLASFLKCAPGDYRWAIELRDPSWLCEPIFQILEDFQVALCIHDRLDDHPCRITTNWTHFRFHGSNYAGSYSRQRLTSEAHRITNLIERGIDVYIYFNNDVHGHAIFNAADLRRYVQSSLGALQRMK